MPVREMLVRLGFVGANAAGAAAGFAIAGTGHPAHAVVGFLLVGLAVFGIGVQAWDAVRVMRGGGGALPRQSPRGR
jgi:hypothetical protein